MNLIVAADKEWGIGKNGDLLDNIPEDMKFFRETTLDKVVIMGAVTLRSLPNEKPLPKRVNLILCNDNSLDDRDDLTIFPSMEECVDFALKNYKSEDIFFIGGASVYNACTDYIDTAYITKIDKAYGADRFIKNFDEMENWEIAEEREQITEKGLKLTFTTYKKTSNN